LAIFFVAWWVLRAVATEDVPQGTEWRYDTNRINELRRVDLSYRLFQPLIRGLARLNRGAFRDQLPDIQRDNQHGRHPAVLARRGIPGAGPS